LFLISTDSNTISNKYNNNKKENNNIDSYNLKTPKKLNNKNVKGKRDKTHLNRLKNNCFKILLLEIIIIYFPLHQK
jgi:hypothetical protein